MSGYLDAAFVVLLIVCSIAMLIFWIQCLVDAARLDAGSGKVVWVLIILFGGILGALAFRFAGPKRAADIAGDDSDEAFLRQMREEMEGDAAERRPRLVLTAEEERVIAEMRRSHRGETGA